MTPPEAATPPAATASAINAPHLVALVRAGASFVNGSLIELSEDQQATEWSLETAA
jgi:hypothetical protein